MILGSTQQTWPWQYQCVLFTTNNQSVFQVTLLTDRFSNSIPGFCLQLLGLPPLHIFAVEGLSTNTALRLAALYVQVFAHILTLLFLMVPLLFLSLRFPDMCLTLTLVNVPPPTECVIRPSPFAFFASSLTVCSSIRLKDVFETYGEMLNMWCYPTDIEEFEHACLMLLEFALGEDITPDIQDEVRASPAYPREKKWNSNTTLN